MVQLTQLTRQLSANARTIRAMLETIPEDQAQWKPDEQTWSLQEVMDHIYNEERVDFRSHLEEFFSHPQQPWGALKQEWVTIVNCQKALALFLEERENSIEWLSKLESPDWAIPVETPFNDGAQKIILTAGDVMVSWVAHDFLHMRQLNELLFAWNQSRADPFKVEYAGNW